MISCITRSISIRVQSWRGSSHSTGCAAMPSCAKGASSSRSSSLSCGRARQVTSAMRAMSVQSYWAGAESVTRRGKRDKKVTRRRGGAETRRRQRFCGEGHAEARRCGGGRRFCGEGPAETRDAEILDIALQTFSPPPRDPLTGAAKSFTGKGEDEQRQQADDARGCAG